MLIERKGPPGYQVWEIDSYLIVIPVPDILPHGFKQENGEYVINDDHALLCACNPEVSIGRNGFMYDKPIVTHNSFIDINELAVIKRIMDEKEM